MTLRVAQISTYDTAGGAALPVYRLHRELIGRNHHSRMLVARKDSNDPSVEAAPRHAGGVFGKVRCRLRRERIARELAPYRSTRPDWPEKFSDDRSSWDWRDPERFGSLDLINLHWVAGFVDYAEFFQAVPHQVPVVWTLHDMNTFTGGCHYDAGCQRFTARCGACPQLGSSRDGDLSRRIWTGKDDLFASLDGSRLHFVTPSRWMAEEVERSSLLGGRFAVTVIPNGVNTDEFSPRDRAAARATLGIPHDSSVVLFVAYSVAPRRKGFDLLREALLKLTGLPDLLLLSVGAGTAPDLAVPQLHLGKVAQSRFLSLVYSAADLYVIPSRQDNLPSTVLESMACGTPVVGFDVGGIPDMVQPGRTGALCPAGDAPSLALAIESLLGDPEGRAEMSTRCRERIVEEYSMEGCVSRYEGLYERLVERALSGEGPADP